MAWALMSAKVYLNLTLPITNAALEKQKYYNTTCELDMHDTRFRPYLLDDAFFAGLDALFTKHLFPSFQSFGIQGGIHMVYDQNKVPNMATPDDDDEEEDNTANGISLSDAPVDIVNLDWVSQFKGKYFPAVKIFILKWVADRKKNITHKDDLKALDILWDKVDTLLTCDLEGKERITDISWHHELDFLPMFTPTLMNCLLGALNDVEEGAISVCDPQVGKNLLIWNKLDADVIRAYGMAAYYGGQR